MAKSQSLASLSVVALLKLRDDIGTALSKRSKELQQQLAILGGNIVGNGRKAKRSKSLKGRKVAPKYRGPGGKTWAGRGATPRWMAEAVKSGAKKEDFLIAKRTPVKKKSSKKKSSPKEVAAVA